MGGAGQSYQPGKWIDSILFLSRCGITLLLEIEKAEYIICRAGYSTLMDLTAFRKN